MFEWILLAPLMGYLKPILKFADDGTGDDNQDSNNQDDNNQDQNQDYKSQDSGNWWETLPDNIKSHPVLKKYKSKDDAVAALVAAQELIGADKIIIPSKDADEKEWNERVFDRLGRPKKADEYPIPQDIKLPEEVNIDDNMVKGFKEVAHKVGLLPRQFEAIYRWYMDNLINQHNTLSERIQTSMQEAESKLRQEYGAAYDQNIALARKLIKQFATPEAFDELNKGLGNNPHVVKMMVNIAKTMSEDQLVGKPKTLTMTPEEARLEISKIKGDLKGPYYDPQHPEHQAVVEKMQMLYKLAHPE